MAGEKIALNTANIYYQFTNYIVEICLKNDGSLDSKNL